MPALKNSAASPRSDSVRTGFPGVLPTALVSLALLALVVLAASWCYRNGYILYYGDAQSHLNISRALIDSRTPGLDQFGTVWLPVLHLLCLPFVRSDWLWSTGLAGTIPVALCFVIAGTCFYLAAAESYRESYAAAVVVACFALNPNVLYLATIPMTEIVFLAGLALLLLSVLRFRRTGQLRWIAAGIGASWLLTLTRYDGWFLIPVISLWFAISASKNKAIIFFSVAAAAGLAPLLWLAYNWWETGNALDFYNGPYSARAIQGSASYPGYRDWIVALHYYGTAAKLCSGLALVLLGVAGALCAYARRTLQPVLFLLLTPAFYVWSMHSSGGTPIHVPVLWPFTYYNSRYGIAVVPLCAFAAGAISLVLPVRFKKLSILIPFLAAVPWLLPPSKQNWICWKESDYNSIDRRAWTTAAAAYLQAHYHSGEGILTSTGDVTGIFCRTRIHLSETLNIGNGPMWFLATTRPDLYHPNTWAVVQQGDFLSKALSGTPPPYDPVLTVTTSKFSPPLSIQKQTTP